MVKHLLPPREVLDRFCAEMEVLSDKEAIN